MDDDPICYCGYRKSEHVGTTLANVKPTAKPCSNGGFKRSLFLNDDRDHPEMKAYLRKTERKARR